jgi:hypothetical protein
LGKHVVAVQKKSLAVAQVVHGNAHNPIKTAVYFGDFVL